MALGVGQVVPMLNAAAVCEWNDWHVASPSNMQDCLDLLGGLGLPISMEARIRCESFNFECFEGGKLPKDRPRPGLDGSA